MMIFLSAANLLFFSISMSRTNVIFNKFATESSLNRTTMNRNIIRTLFAVCTTTLLLHSCNPVEPTKYTEKFYRVASVDYYQGKATLLIDYTNERYYFSNFETPEDMEYFGVSHGDRVIAGITLNATGNIFNNKLTLNEIAKFPVTPLAESRPSDSLNYKYQFDVLFLGNTKYPKIWSQGHLVNVTPSYTVSSEDKEAIFHLYPTAVRHDTLSLQMYADIPDTISTVINTQSLLCFDISSLRDSVGDAAEMAYRDSLYNLLAALKQDTITVQLFSADTLRDKCMTANGVKERKYFVIPKAQLSVPIPFDF